MTRLTKFQRLICGMVCALSLGACGTASKVAAPSVAVPVAQKMAPTIDDAMAQATLASNAGQNDKALTLLKGAAAAFPEDKAPWLRMAQLKYEAGHYGDAIIQAQEALVRDPNDKLASSIVAISGLRLSTRALSDLSRQNNLSGSLRTESQDLAKLLRESLNETQLVPPRDKPVLRSAQKKPARHASAKSRRAAAPAARQPEPASNANPFGGLK